MAAHCVREHIIDGICFHVPMILTESRDEFVSFRTELIRDINPAGFLEEIFAAELASHTWEIARLQRCKTLVINMAFEYALIELLSRTESFDYEEECAELARAWFTEPSAKRKVTDLLAKLQLDEAAIVAQATRNVLKDLQQLDRMISRQQSLRDKLLRSLVTFRSGFAIQIKEAIARVDDRPSLECPPG